ncbi:MAG: tetratricopeptide repeat protein [Thiohalocapsa sp.]|jgi:tetratricopeptide (TPR) repeat protein|uniref:tetratricopeptide repeat protein n=1 Tax=Thiohalocapsa sp. TaxID=2497641 RepID=UPI0025F7615D|nr:tetratricopeptide repeat protein [Thiohalocapsa sp.]MCG6941771.1 tetratricopeptide repeat protein [Thiohalocapsa sp.]
MTDGHSTFTPSNPAKLEALFVAREPLARSLMASIRDSALSGNKHQRLLVGPRGIGKTHLVALIYHRVRADTELSARLRIAWLPEDPYVPGYAQLLALILRRLRDDEPDLDWLGERLEAVLDVTDTSRQEAMLEGLIAETLQNPAADPAANPAAPSQGERTLLLLAENLDDLLADLRQDGQRKLRALIQNTARLAILATTTSLTDPLTDKKEAFYGFFRTQRLEPFGVEDAAELLARLAEHTSDSALADLIWSPLGLARVRAVHYLAGGNPRVYVIFHEFLTRESLDELVRPFLKLMDELTPYYQARMARLAPLQRGIVDTLRRLKVAVPVKTIAREVMVSPQSASTQLGKLVELGYVLQADSIGRNNYYELREPLMRLCLDVKEQRGETIPLFIDFLRIWYSSSELSELAGSTAHGGLERSHLQAAVERARSEPDPLRATLDQAFLSAVQEGDYQRALAEIDCALERDPHDKTCWERKADCLEALNAPPEDQLACWRRVTEIDPEDSLGWSWRGFLLDQLGRFDEALRASARAVALKPDDPALNRDHGWNLKRAGRNAEARQYLERAMELIGEPASAADWEERGDDLQVIQGLDDAVRAYGKALALEPRRMDAWRRLLGALQEQGRSRTCQRVTDAFATLMPESALGQAYRGFARHSVGDLDTALRAYDRALELDPELDQHGTPLTLEKAAALTSSGRPGEALALLSQPQPGYKASDTFKVALEHAEALLWLDRWDDGRVALDGLLAKTRPPVWSGEDLGNVRWLPARTQRPQVWRRHIALWLELFGKHGLLTELGEALVRSLRTLAIDWLPQQSTQAWLDTWRALAGDIPQLQLPLRLLAAGIAYQAAQRPEVLLNLPREERGLLEPWLANLLRTGPDALDRELDTLLADVERKLAEAAEAGRQRAFWIAEPPSPNQIDLDAVLARYSDAPEPHPAHLLPDAWQRLDGHTARTLVGRMIRALPDAARALARSEGLPAPMARPGPDVLLIERRPLSFSDLDLIQVHLAGAGQAAALDLLAGDAGLVLLDGNSATPYALVADGRIRLDTDVARADYTRWFCASLRAEGGRFEIIDAGAWLDAAAEPTVAVAADSVPLTPWRHLETDDAGRPVYAATISHAGKVYVAKLRLDPGNGSVEMLAEQPADTTSPLPRERIDGPLRFLV